jgi:hypothetical protein
MLGLARVPRVRGLPRVPRVPRVSLRRMPMLTAPIS